LIHLREKREEEKRNQKKEEEGGTPAEKIGSTG
jgi:hypothetical protein